MIFSFIGEKQGRVLQAHFGHQGLVIWKSQLYDFSTEAKARKPTELFLQYMSSEIQDKLILWAHSIFSQRIPLATGNA
jgi:hypothetical protein